MLANRLLRRRGVALAASATSAIALAAGVSLSTPATAQSSGTGSITYQVHPFAKLYKSGTKPGAFPSPSDCIKAYGLACYTPSEIRQAYDIPDSWTGQGQSIAIIDAYGSPTVQSDLDVFDAAMGLPKFEDLHVYCPTGCPSTMTAHDGQPDGWAGETSLDVQWAHAIAPDATINLVVAGNNYGNSLNNAVQYAVDHKLGNVLSMSYGADEAYISGGGNNLQLEQSHQAFQNAVNAGVSLFASSGDWGASDGFSSPTASYPASDPLVTAVGGTNLFTKHNGAYDGEWTWNDSDPATCPFTCKYGAIGATGGAVSTIFDDPVQQAISGLDGRSPSDVAYNASVYTSVLVYLGFNADPADNGFYFFGGTSSGSPQWAAIGALANAQNGGASLTSGDSTFRQKLYGIYGTPDYATDFHDVTIGNNRFFGPGYDAKPGYDVPTGLGSPDVQNLVATLTGGSSSTGSTSPGNGR
ncbi:MAG TPA: S53 family peptidase [Nocardioidaceae bacterium]|nr:S53 family peptidase [Nocardioidaceae bacterium]